MNTYIVCKRNATGDPVFCDIVGFVEFGSASSYGPTDDRPIDQWEEEVFYCPSLTVDQLAALQAEHGSSIWIIDEQKRQAGDVGDFTAWLASKGKKKGNIDHITSNTNPRNTKPWIFQALGLVRSGLPEA